LFCRFFFKIEYKIAKRKPQTNVDATINIKEYKAIYSPFGNSTNDLTQRFQVISSNRDLLTPQDIRERKLLFCATTCWVGTFTKIQHLVKTGKTTILFGIDAAGTGNLLVSFVLPLLSPTFTHLH
jgi:hypothetical protein